MDIQTDAWKRKYVLTLIVYLNTLTKEEKNVKGPFLLKFFLQNILDS